MSIKEEYDLWNKAVRPYLINLKKILVQYWEKQFLFPKLSQAALNAFKHCPSSVSVERFFSETNRILKEERSSMSFKSFKALAIIKGNPTIADKIGKA